MTDAITFAAGLITGLALGFALCRMVRRCRPDPSPQPQHGGIFMFQVKGTESDKRYEFRIIAADVEGTPVPGDGSLPAGFTAETVVDNPDAVVCTPDADAPLKGSISFGTADPTTGEPREAHATCTIKNADGEAVLVIDGHFIVTAGDAATIKSGNMVVEGLTEAPEV